MKLIIINRQDTDDTVKVTGSKVKGQLAMAMGNMVNSIAPEPLKGFEPKLTQIFPTVGP